MNQYPIDDDMRAIAEAGEDPREAQLWSAKRRTFVGLLILLVGGSITFGTYYFAASGGIYLLAYGALAVGTLYTMIGSLQILYHASSLGIFRKWAIVVVSGYVVLGAAGLLIYENMLNLEPPESYWLVWDENEPVVTPLGQTVVFSGEVINNHAEWSIQKVVLELTFDESATVERIALSPYTITPLGRGTYSASLDVPWQGQEFLEYDTELSWEWIPP